jgi:hypothetical protein
MVAYQRTTNMRLPQSSDETVMQWLEVRCNFRATELVGFEQPLLKS